MRFPTFVFVSSIALAGTAIAQPVPDPADPTRDPWTPTDPRDPVEPVSPDPIVTPPVIDPDPMRTPDPITAPTPVVYEEPILERLGVAISAGGGVSGFTGNTLRASTNDGGLWDVRASLGTRSRLAFEAAYVGSAQQLDAFGLGADAMLVSNGVQGNLRLNLVERGPVQPFLFAGAAWRRYNVTNTDFNTSNISDSDDVFEVPMGVGVAYRVGNLLFDARGELRAATDEDLMPSLSAEDPSDSAVMHRYGINGNVGFEF